MSVERIEALGDGGGFEKVEIVDKYEVDLVIGVSLG